jgi:bifunctional DNA-binding transcriptional regulator/antitoxin component of YhaV-PrlF toxin-antitoxin module
MAFTASISSKGQVVIPAALRKKYRLGPRTKVVFGEQNGKLTMESTALDQVLALRGCLSHVEEDVEAWWMEEKRKERALENAKIEELR